MAVIGSLSAQRPTRLGRKGGRCGPARPPAGIPRQSPSPRWYPACRHRVGALLTSLQRRLKSCRVLAPWRETSRSRTNALRSVRAWGAEILDAYARRFCWQRLKRGTAACRDTDFFQARVHVADPYPSRPRRAHAEMMASTLLRSLYCRLISPGPLGLSRGAHVSVAAAPHGSNRLVRNPFSVDGVAAVNAAHGHLSSARARIGADDPTLIEPPTLRRTARPTRSQTATGRTGMPGRRATRPRRGGV